MGFSWHDHVLDQGTVPNMLQTSHGMSIPALVPPCFEEPSYGINTSSSRPPPFTMCQPHASGPNSVVPSARVLQEVLYSNEMNFPSYMPDMPNNQGLPLPWMSSWHQRQNLPYLGHPHPGKNHSVLEILCARVEQICFQLIVSAAQTDMLVSFDALQKLINSFELEMLLNSCRSFIYVLLKLLSVFA